MTEFVSIAVPSDLLAHTGIRRCDYADCYQATVAAGAPLPDVDLLARLFFSDAMPRWIRSLLSLRNRAVQSFGLKHDDWTPVDPRAQGSLAVDDKVGPWRIVARSREEIVFAQDDRHLRFALSLRVSAVDRTVQASTLVEFHNTAGRAYFIPVKPFHRLLVPRHMDSVLRAAATCAQGSCGRDTAR